MEQFDLVDELDNVIGVTDKKTAHEQKLVHRAVAVFLFNRAGLMYVQVHNSDNLLDHSVGGHVQQGESYLDAAHREAQEELGLLQPLKQLASFYSDEGERKHMFGLFECVAEDNWVFTPNDEVKELRLMTLFDIESMMQINPDKFTGGFRNTFKKFLELRIHQ